MIGKKINQLATELAPVSTDLTIIGDPISGVSKKITLAQLGAIFSGAVSFYTNLAGFPATGDINVIYCAKDTQKLYLWSGSAYVEVSPSQALLDTYQLRSEKGVSNGYASLDSSGKVPISQLPSSIMEYKGTWNAATNTPTLANGTGDTGDVYICNVAGTVNFGAGAITFAVGDYVIYSGTIWQRSSGAVGTVTSVAASITGNAIGITGSPVTTSGTLAFAFAGTGAQYIKGDGTLATFPSTIAQAERLITEVYNSTGATLTKGTIVYINGGQGNLPTVTKALATGDSTSAQTFGVVQADITNMNNGYVVVAGKLSDLDTQAYTEGTQLYLSSTTAGAWTSTKQYAPAHLVYVGIVVRSHPTQGIVEIKIQNGYELDELHNVAAQTPTNNDGLFWESATSLWKNKSIATVLGYTPQPQLSGTGFVKISGTTISYDNSTYLTTSAAATTYLPMVLSSTANFVDINGQQFSIYGSAGGFTSGRIIVDPVFSAIGYQNAGVFDGLKILTNGNAEFTNSGVTRFFNQVRFDSTLTNGTYTYTLPSATGTLALTSQIPANPVGGTGTTNYIPKFTGTSTIGNSIISESGSDINVAGFLTAINGIYKPIDNAVDTIRIYRGNTSPYLNESAIIDAQGGMTHIRNKANDSVRSIRFSFSTDGSTTYSEAMRLNASGNLSIGNTNDTYKLDVSGTGRFTGALISAGLISTSNIIVSAGFGILVGGGGFAIGPSSTRGIIGINGSGDQLLTFSTQSYIYNSSSLFRMLSSSDIDFVAGGTQRLLISASTGAATFSSSVTAGGYLANGSTTIGMPIDTGGTKAYFDASSINGPALTLRADSVGRTIRMTSDAIGTVVGAIDSNSSGLNIGTNSSHSIIFKPQAVEAMRILPGGNVGIGTTSPSTKLHIGGVGSAISFDTTGATATSIIKTILDYELSIQNNRGTGSEIIVGNEVLSFKTNSAERMRITSGGNVEINTGSIKTGAPTNGTAQPWKLGNAVSGSISTDSYIIVSVNGTTYSIPALNGLP